MATSTSSLNRTVSAAPQGVESDHSPAQLDGTAEPRAEQSALTSGHGYGEPGDSQGHQVGESDSPTVPDALKDRMAACVACHGANFSAPLDPAYPRLAGQHADYLYAALKSYHTDGNPHLGRSNATMRAQVVQEADGKKKLTFTNAELKLVAQYLSALPGDLRVVPQSRFR